MEKFPIELPKLAIRQLYNFATRTDPDIGKAALAAWQVLGYAGHLTFGEVSIAPEMPLIGDNGPINWGAVVEEAEQKEFIPPALIDLAVTIFVRWLKKRLTK